MSNIYITSDTHYGHRNIIDYCKRPYSSVHEMNQALIENHNSVVKPNDLVFHLGDFAFCREPERIFDRLNGRIHLIQGNHDSKKALAHCKFEWIKDVYMLKAGKHEFWLSHYAHLRWPKSHHGVFHLFGHSHGSLVGFGRSMDVGVDCHNYKPIHVEEAAKFLEQKEPTEHH